MGGQTDRQTDRQMDDQTYRQMNHRRPDHEYAKSRHDRRPEDARDAGGLPGCFALPAFPFTDLFGQLVGPASRRRFSPHALDSTWRAARRNRQLLHCPRRLPVG